MAAGVIEGAADALATISFLGEGVAMGRHIPASLPSRAKIKLKTQWCMCSQFYSDWRARYQANPRKSEKNRIVRCFDLPQWYQAVGSFMRISMSIMKNEHGVYHVRKKVPKALEQSVAQV
ncbi:MAG: hypothetical protein WAK04_20215 [Xanthobacteraceae bacterium]